MDSGSPLRCVRNDIKTIDSFINFMTLINTRESDPTIDRPTRHTRAVFEAADGRFICTGKDTPGLHNSSACENGDNNWRQALSIQDDTCCTVTCKSQTFCMQVNGEGKFPGDL